MTRGIVLGSAIRSTLLSNIQTQRTLDQTTLRLATGLSVNSALDNPQNFFASQSLDNRSNDLQRLLDGIGQSIRTVQEADAGISALTRLTEQAEAVAQEALELSQSAPTEARTVGDEDLSQVNDLTEIAGINNGDQLVFTIREPDTVSYFATDLAVTVNTGDNVDQLVAEINALNNNPVLEGREVFDASVNASGNLDLRILDDSIVNIAFRAVTFSNADSLNFADAIGFGEQASLLNGGGFEPDSVQFTLTSGREIRSFDFVDIATGRVARRGDSFNQLRAADSGLGLFFGVDTANDSLAIGINGGAEDTITLGPNLTIQGFIDGVNTSNVLGNSLEADFDDETGQLVIRAIDNSVQSIETGLSTSDPAFVASFFGFNVEIPLYFGSEDRDSIQLGSVAGPDADRINALESDYNNILDQIDAITEDASYRGINLLAGDNLTTDFNENRSNTLVIEGQDFSSNGLGIERARFDTLNDIQDSLDTLRGAISEIRDFGQSIANDLSVIETRQEFTRTTINTLDAGGDDLTVADQNEEGAALLAAQTRQTLGITVLSIVSQSQSQILSLF